MSVMRLYPLGVAFFAVPVAVCVVRRRPVAALLLILCAAAAAAVVLPWREVAYYTAAAGVGLALGAGVERRWPYGRIVAVVATLAFGVALADVLTSWQVWHARAFWSLDWLAEYAEEFAKRQPDSDTDFAQRVLRWVRTHWDDVVFGLLFWPSLLGACCAVSLTGRLARRGGREAGPRGAFRNMRAPEWLVWLAIAAGVAWFADHRGSSIPLRMATWNAAIALAAVYWLNAVSVLAYAAAVLRPRPWVVAVVVLFLLYSGSHLLLCLLGLFDTWGDFRRKVDALAAWKNRLGGSDTLE